MQSAAPSSTAGLQLHTPFRFQILMHLHVAVDNSTFQWSDNVSPTQGELQLQLISCSVILIWSRSAFGPLTNASPHQLPSQAEEKLNRVQCKDILQAWLQLCERTATQV